MNEEGFKAYYIWANITIENVIPGFATIVLNALIIRKLWETPNRFVKHRRLSVQRRLYESSKTLTIVVAIFLLARSFEIFDSVIFIIEGDKSN